MSERLSKFPPLTPTANSACVTSLIASTSPRQRLLQLQMLIACRAAVLGVASEVLLGLPNLPTLLFFLFFLASYERE